MLCLEKFFEDTNISRCLFAEAIGVSVDSVRKYEWSLTDNMRQRTIEKIENGARRLMDKDVKMTKTSYFGDERWVMTTNDPKRKIIETRGWYNAVGALRFLIEAA